jgi:hypothetical protein
MLQVLPWSLLSRVAQPPCGLFWRRLLAPCTAGDSLPHRDMLDLCVLESIFTMAMYLVDFALLLHLAAEHHGS